jgi:apolipoprotein N-acyltransferase
MFVDLAQRVAALTGWRRLALAVALGASTALTLAPFYALPLLIPCFVGLAWMTDGCRRLREVVLVHYAFGYGFIAVGCYWIGISFLVEADRFAWLLPLPILGLPLFLGLFTALGGLVAGLLWGPGWRRAAVLALGWTAGEAVRGNVLTGFPWNLIGYVWGVSEPTMQGTAWFGPYGLGFATVLVATLPAVLGDAHGNRRGHLAATGAGAALVVALVAAGSWRLSGPAVADVPGVMLRLVQPGIDQATKWLDTERDKVLRRHLELTAGPGGDKTTVVVWPETAVPFLIEHDALRRQAIAAAMPPEAVALIGAVRRSPLDQPLQIWNSVYAVNGTGQILGSYDKRHLVPFGEFMPMRWLFSLVHLDQLAVGSLDFSRGEGSALISLPGLPSMRPLICYEGVFPDEVAVSSDARAGMLLNVTNDGWFGDSSGPHQHFDMTRFRAVEQGLPLVRAANTGISAIVDPYGRVRTQLPLGRVGVVDGPLPQALAQAPLYGRYGEWLLLPWVVLGLLCGNWRRRGHSKTA